MDTITAPTAVFNSTISSTGTCPSDWRAWWAIEARRCGSDWQTLLQAAEQALNKLRVHVGASS